MLIYGNLVWYENSLYQWGGEAEEYTNEYNDIYRYDETL
jgi:hypothetical protein